MLRPWIRGIVLGMIAGSWDLVVQPFLPGFISCSFVVPLLVLAVVRHRTLEKVLARLVGVMLIEWSFSFATGYEAIRWIVITGVLYLVFEHWITNASLVAVIFATGLGRLGEQFFLRAFEMIGRFFGSVHTGIHDPLLPTVLWDIATAVSVYVFFAWFSQDRGKVASYQKDGWML